jgi:magnesium transporter
MLRKFRLDGGKIAECPNGACGEVDVYVAPDEAEKRHLVDVLKLDEHTLNSALDPDELARLEFEPEHVALIYKRPRNYTAEEPYQFRVASTGLFLFKDKLVVVIADDVPLFDGKQLSKASSLVDVLLRLIYRSIFQYLEHLRTITMVTDSLEHKISSSMENKYLLSLFTLEKSLVYYLNAINSNSALIEKLKYNAVKIGFNAEELEFIDDITIENTQCYKQAEIYSNILAGLMDARASIVNNNLNVLMKTLNIITIGIMVPTFVVSAFSMNVPIPFQHYPYAFYGIMGLAALSVLTFMLAWRHRNRTRGDL